MLNSQKTFKVSESLRNMGKERSVWWLDTLQLAEQNKDFSSELTRKIEEAIHGSLNNSSSSRATSRLVLKNLQFHELCCCKSTFSAFSYRICLLIVIMGHIFYM